MKNRLETDCLGFGGACPFLRRVAENVIREGVPFPVGSVPGAWRGCLDPEARILITMLYSLYESGIQSQLVV